MLITVAGRDVQQQDRLPPEFDSPWAQQSPYELFWLLSEIAGSTSILEIGSCYGNALRMFALAMAGGKIVAIDMGTLGPASALYWGVDVSERLKQTAKDLYDCGFGVHLMFGDSHDAKTVEWAKQHGPYDFVFIDGDHTYEGVKRDWLDYGPLGRKVGFHDIANKAYASGVVQFWNELKQQDGLIIKEKIDSRHSMGIGLVEWS